MTIDWIWWLQWFLCAIALLGSYCFGRLHQIFIDSETVNDLLRESKARESLLLKLFQDLNNKQKP